MGKWHPVVYYTSSDIMEGDRRLACVSHQAAARLLKAHNAEIATLTAERDELQRRLVEYRRAVEIAEGKRAAHRHAEENQ